MSLAVVSVAAAHHSAAATYEADESIRIAGRVLEFAWTNPHSHVYIAVAEGPFKGRTYTVELSSPAALVAEGWTRTMFRPGDAVIMNVNPSRTGAPAGLCRNCPLTVNGQLKKSSGS